MRAPATIGLATALAAAALVGVPAAGAPPVAASTTGFASQDSGAGPVAGGLIVEYAPGAPVREAPGVPTGSDSVSVVDLEMGARVTDDLRTVEFDSPQPAAVAEAAAAQLERDPAVLSAEPDWVVSLDATPRTVQTSATWGLDRIDQRSGLNSQYDYGTTGAGVDVYVIDSGIVATHVEFTGRVGTGTTFVSDGRGTGDCNGHGTHVAGTIAGTTYGVAKQARVIPVRVFPCSGSTYTSTVISAIEWVRINRIPGRPAVINMSLGGGLSTSLNATVGLAVDSGIVVVVASGNDAVDSCYASPASALAAITVNASTSSDAYSSFTNYGACSDIYAPGSSITSAWWNSNTATATISGTSMAAPHVAGAAARVLERTPNATPAAVWSAIDAASTAVNFNRGSGDPNKLLYVDPLDAVPGAPASVSAAPDYESLDVTWSAPASGLAPTHYAIEYSDDSVTWTVDDTTTGTSATIDGLLGARAYWVRVRSVNANGPSAWTVSSPATTLAPAAPGPVTGIDAMIDDTTLRVTWSAPVDTGGRPTLYYLVSTSTDDTTWVADDSVATTSATIDGLANGTPYRVRIQAVNAVGTGAPATSATTYSPRTLTVPSVPRTLAASGVGSAINATWSSPADTGGRAVTAYAVQSSTDDSTWTSHGTVTGTSTTIGSLVNGQAYSVRVAAINAIGQGPWATTSATPAAPPPPPPPPPSGGGGGGAPPPPPAPVVKVPGLPVISSASSADAAVTVAWAAPDDTGGADVTSYAVHLQGADLSTETTVTQTTHTFIPLTNGEAYRVRVAAVNSAGQGEWSAWTDDLIPLGPASPPESVAAAAGDRSAALTWQPPLQTGGSEVMGYTVEVQQGTSVQELAVDDTGTTLVGLVNGMAYAVRVAAVTDVGLGAWSPSLIVIPRAAPVSAPTNVRATLVKRTVRVTWSKPAAGAPLRYVVSASINGNAPRRIETSTTRATFTVPARTTSVVVSVAAVDRYGRGPASDPVRPRRAG